MRRVVTQGGCGRWGMPDHFQGGIDAYATLSVNFEYFDYFEYFVHRAD
jgi:hypothetical protein